MTIGFDASRAFIEDRTGTENYSFQLLKALAKIDTKNHYLIYIRKTQKSKAESQKWPSNFQFLIVNFQFLWTQVGLAFRTWFDPLDVLFVPSHTLPLLKKPGLKTVLTVHDLGAEYLPGLHQLKQILYLKLMTHYQLKTATKIIAVSKATKQDLIKKIGIRGEKIKVVYEGVGKEFNSQKSKVKSDAEDSIVKHYGLERGKYFLFVGTIQPRKNLERLIKAFSMFVRGAGLERGPVDPQPHSTASLASSLQALNGAPRVSPPLTPSYKNHYQLPTTNYKLVLVGQKGWKSDPIYELPKKLGIEDRVLFTGRISDEDLVGLYNGATALVYTSLFEGFGLPILEAFACGCPVITSNISSMPEIAGNAAILVDPEKENEILDAMLEISINEKVRDNLIQLGLRRIEEFSWEKTARDTLKLLNEVVRSR